MLYEVITTLEDLTALVDVEGRGLLAVERAQPDVVHTPLLECDVATHNVQDADRRPDLLDKIFT